MSELATANRTDFTAEQVDLLRRTICNGASNDEMALFLGQCRRTGLDPFARQIYLVKRKGKMCIQVGIDGYRLIADRTGQYAGNDNPIIDDEQIVKKATVVVYKLVGGVRCPFTATARWSQYCPEPPNDFMWHKMPHLMLGKCAEALALRKAFPAELSGLYIAEEMEQAGRADAVLDMSFISTEDCHEVYRIIEKCGVDQPAFLKWAQVPEVEQIVVSNLPKVMDMLRRKERELDAAKK